MSRILKYDLGTVEESAPKHVYVGGKLKPMTAQLQNGRVSVWVLGTPRWKGAMGAWGREYTFYKVETGKNPPDGAKYCGTINHEDLGYVEHIFMLDTTAEAHASGDRTRDVSLQALDI